MVPLVDVSWMLIQQRAPDQPVIAIDIADADAEQQPRAEVVRLADPDPVRRVLPLQLVAVHQAGIGPDQASSRGSSPTSYWPSPSV